MLGTGLEENGVTLSSVLGKLSVHKLNEVISDWHGEDTGHGDAVGDFLGVIALVDGDYGSGGHLFYLKCIKYE